MNDTLKPRIPKKGKIDPSTDDEFLPEISEVPSDEDPTLKVSIFNRTWAFLDRKKTVIGFVATTAGTFIVGGPVGAGLRIAGAIIGGVGVTHKAGKALNEKTSGEKINWGDLIQAILNFFKKLLKKG